MYWDAKIVPGESNALAVCAKANRAAEELSKFVNSRAAAVDKGQGLRNDPEVRQAPDLGDKCGSAPLCNMLFQTLQARPECCVDGDVSGGFLNYEGCRRVHEAMVPNQIFDGVQRGASSGKYIVNNAQFPRVGFHCQMKAKTIVADQLCDLIDECNAL
jgi:hypothetical protein